MLVYGIITLSCLGLFLTEALRAPVIEHDEANEPLTARVRSAADARSEGLTPETDRARPSSL